ncbi:uncharacterized protein KD926_004716 [Aspergillus affinis]|uniref:uncharacterized protein n=1 Tax=Aspergillus affinis TaxID=1070780 RepID=UPI0022FDF4CF|nr:uncharacterized protein KD926_004716 [Aspergillus affinis]KAI9042926.1 hypothetical protein KD926_004716 [Aspergillus affinis]
MAQQPTYILAPNFHFKPGTGPIALGNIIADPLRPHRALTTVDATTLKAAYPRIETFTDYERSITRGSSRDVSMSVWAEFLNSVSAKVSGSRGSDVQSTYTMDSLESMFFVNDPTLEEIRSRLKAPMVQAVTKAGRIPGFRTPVYMVTGLMVAKGFSADLENTQRRGGEVELSGNAPSPVGQVGAGAGLARSTSTEKADQWKAGEDIVFAYQLLKIEVKGWKGDRIIYDELRHKSALLSNDEEDDTDDEEEEEEEEGLQEVVISSIRADNLPSGRDAGGFAVSELGENQDHVHCIFTT